MKYERAPGERLPYVGNRSTSGPKDMFDETHPQQRVRTVFSTSNSKRQFLTRKGRSTELRQLFTTNV
jgi:hypothetical protein